MLIGSNLNRKSKIIFEETLDKYPEELYHKIYMEISSSNNSLGVSARPSKSSNFLFFVIIFLVSFLIGSILPRIFLSQGKQQQSGYVLPEDQLNLVVQKNLLQNPMLSFWTANLDGKVILKDKGSFILSHIIINRSVKGKNEIQTLDDGKTIKINYVEGKTIIKRVNERTPNDPSTAVPINLSELKIGDIVNGNVEIKNSGNNWIVEGQAFFVQIK